MENGARIKRARERLQSNRPAANHRADRPISQEDFAPLVSTTRRHLIRLENGEHLPSAELRDRIVETTGTEERIESSDDEEEHLPWQILYPAADLETVLRLRATAKKNLRRAAEIEDALCNS
jgi:transcriptional regulator with XRE-family HTH domain